ncbi:MAG: hypothetical protein ACQETL_18570 [Bacteroidota bacterium]
MENYHKCDICEKSILSEQGSEMTPRQMADMKTDSLNENAKTIIAFSISVIVYNNPPNSEDKPMCWVCKECQSLYLYPGHFAENISQGEKLQLSYNEESKKKWWQFWK